MAKVKDFPKLDKSDGSIANTDHDSYKQRLQVINNQKRLKQLEHNQLEQNDKLIQMSKQLDLIVSLLSKEN